MRLTKLGKIVFTTLLVVVSIIIYIGLGKVGKLEIPKNYKEFLAIIGWCWLFIQPFMLSAILEK